MAKITTTTIEHSASWQLKALLALAQVRGRHGDFLPAGLGSRAELARHLSTLCQDAAQSGEVLLSTICEPQTPLAVLQGIKELAKSLAGKASTEQERAAASFLYHAAVATALGRHGKNISSRSGSARSELYEDLAALMTGDPLGQVFAEAAERLTAEPPSGNSGETA